MRVRLVKELAFEAAHSLLHAPEGHKCRRHSLAVVRPIVDEHLDRRFLEDVSGLENPTFEVLPRRLRDRIRPRLPALAEIVGRETCAVSCRYRGD